MFPSPKPVQTADFSLAVAIDKPAIILVPDIIRWRILVNGFVSTKSQQRNERHRLPLKANHFVKDMDVAEEN